jgi:hypothetical protein
LEGAGCVGRPWAGTKKKDKAKDKAAPKRKSMAVLCVLLWAYQIRRVCVCFDFGCGYAQ